MCAAAENEGWHGVNMETELMAVVLMAVVLMETEPPLCVWI